MTDSVDLMVIGVTGEVTRAKLSEKLVKAFNQEAYSFEALLDGAFGESAPYAAQSNVERDLAEQGKDQLEKLGLICTIVATGESVEPLATSAGSGGVDDAATAAVSEADSGLANFKAESDEEADDQVADDSNLAFDVDADAAAGGGLASFKKKEVGDSESTDAPEVDFSDDMVDVGVSASSGLANAKRAKNDVSEIDDSINHDFSDELKDVGSDELSSGLKEGQQAKPDFEADVGEVDFSDDAISIGIREDAEATAAATKTKLDEEVAEINLASFPKEDTETSVDFSDELSLLSGELPAETSGDEAAELSDAAPDEIISDASEGANDTAEALNAELIDPAPAEKPQKDPVTLDDGGLELSSDVDAPLTTPSDKSNAKAPDDGGLSLSADTAAPLTAPKEKANPDAADDGGLSLSSNDAAPLTAPKKKADPDAADDGGLSLSESVDATPAASVPVDDVAAEQPQDSKPVISEAADDNSDQVAAAVSSDSAGSPAKEPVANDVNVDVNATEPENVGSNADAQPKRTAPVASGLVLPGRISNAVVPEITPEEELSSTSTAATASLKNEIPATAKAADATSNESDSAADVVNEAIDNAQSAAGKTSKKKLVAALAGAVVLAGGGTFAFMNAGSINSVAEQNHAEMVKFEPVKDARHSVEKMKVRVADFKPISDLENLPTDELLTNLSNNNSDGILDLEPYFLESGDQVKRGPRIGAAVPAESGWMIGVKNRVPHKADQYFDEWSNRESDLSLFLALLDNLVEKGELEIAQQLSDRAKDKLFAVMSSQRLARAYSDTGQHNEVSRLMSQAQRDTFAIKSPEERVLAFSDYALTEQAIGLNEDAMDTFLKTSILARSLVSPEARTVGLSSAAIYFNKSGRDKQAQELLSGAMKAGNELPENTAARDLAIRYIALSEARMGLFNQALRRTKTIADPFATVSAYHGIALAIESTGDVTNARKVLNMAYRAGSRIDDKEERSKLLSKVVLASEIE